MASSIIIIGLGLLMMFYGCNAKEDPYASGSSRYGCENCCSRIDNQTTILTRMSYATVKLTKDVGEIKIAVVDDIPSELQIQAVSLAKQSTELKAVKTSVNDISISLNKHSEDLFMHDVRLIELGLLFEKQNTFIKGKRNCCKLKIKQNIGACNTCT